MTWATLMHSFESALGALRNYKLRSALTLIGILVGVAGLLVIDVFGQATRVATAAAFGSATLVNVDYAPPATGGVYAGAGQSTLSVQDLQTVQRIPHVIAISPMVGGRFQIAAGSNNWGSMVWGSGPAMQALQNLALKDGRFYPAGGRVRCDGGGPQHSGSQPAVPRRGSPRAVGPHRQRRLSSDRGAATTGHVTRRPRP